MLYFLDQAESFSAARWNAVTILEEARDSFFPTLQFLLDLEELQHPKTTGAADNTDAFDKHFNMNFRLGPNSLNLIIDFFKRIFRLTMAQRYNVSPAEFSLQIDTLNSYAAPLHSLLLHFRIAIDRVEYDPAPFSDLRRQLQGRSNNFTVST